MAFVVDASIAACWLMPDESDAIADRAFEHLQGDPGIVPAHWWFEIRNMFLIAERRGRITTEKFGSILRLLGNLPISIWQDADEKGIVRLARAHRLSFYDAAYLELAQRLAMPIATLDRQLIAAAKAETVALIGLDC